MFSLAFRILRLKLLPVEDKKSTVPREAQRGKFTNFTVSWLGFRLTQGVVAQMLRRHAHTSDARVSAS